MQRFVTTEDTEGRRETLISSVFLRVPWG